MNYMLFICSDGVPSPEKMAVLRREIPGWVEEMDGRGVRLLGRELELPETAVTVRVRDGETLVSDGPFAETKEFVAGFDLLDCADLDEAIEVAAKHASSWFNTVELRPFRDGLRIGGQAPAFGRFDDSAGKPYLLMAWMRTDDPGALEASAAWRRDLDAHVLGGPLEGPDTATTVRVRDGQTRLGDSPFSAAEEFIGCVDVVRCADREQAIALAAGHPLARHAIEVRPFYSE